LIEPAAAKGFYSLPGVKFDKEFPEDAHLKASRGFCSLLEPLFISLSKTCQQLNSIYKINLASKR
jgi:hypothetical protein